MQIKPVGLFLIGIFLVLGICVLELSAITMLFPGTVLDSMWVVNKAGYEQMFPYRILIGLMFFALGLFFIVAVIGWFKRKKWGWYCVVGIFVANGIGDMGRMFGGDIPGGLFGIVVAGLLIYYLTRPKVKLLFT